MPHSTYRPIIDSGAFNNKAHVHGSRSPMAPESAHRDACDPPPSKDGSGNQSNQNETEIESPRSTPSAGAIELPNVPSLVRLPPEILHLIFEYLTPAKSALYRLCLTCRLFKDIAIEHLYSGDVLLRFNGDRVGSRTGVLKMDYPRFGKFTKSLWLSVFPNSLSLPLACGDLTVEKLSDFMTSSVSPGQLQTFVYSGWNGAVDSDPPIFPTVSFLQNQPNIQSLALSFSTMFSTIEISDQMRAINYHLLFPHLRSLYITDMSYLRHVRDLWMLLINKDHTLESLAIICPPGSQLKSFLGYPDLFSDSFTFPKTKVVLHKLRDLYISGFPNLGRLLNDCARNLIDYKKLRMLRLQQCPRIESLLQTVCNAEVMPNLKSLQLVETCSPETFETIISRVAPLETLYIIIPREQNLPKYDLIKQHHSKSLKRLWMEHKNSSYVLDNMLRTIKFEAPPGSGYDGFFLSSWGRLEEVALGVDLVRDSRPIILPDSVRVLRIVGTPRSARGTFSTQNSALSLAKNHLHHTKLKGKEPKLRIISFFMLLPPSHPCPLDYPPPPYIFTQHPEIYLVDYTSVSADGEISPGLTETTIEEVRWLYPHMRIMEFERRDVPWSDRPIGQFKSPAIEMSHLANLPVELQAQIYGLVPAFPELTNLCLVSRNVSAIATPILYSTVTLRPDSSWGLAQHQTRSLFPLQGLNRNLKHIRNVHVVLPRRGRGISQTTIKCIELELPKILTSPGRLMSLALPASHRSREFIMPLLSTETNLHAVHLDISEKAEDVQYFRALAKCAPTLRTLSLRMLNCRMPRMDVLALATLLGKLQQLRSLSLLFQEVHGLPVHFLLPWGEGEELLDSIFRLDKLRELCLYGNDLPFGRWAVQHPDQRFGSALTMFQFECVDRGEPDGLLCDQDDKFYFGTLDLRNVRRLHLCLGVVYSGPNSLSQDERYIYRNVQLNALLNRCQVLEELWVCNLPQVTKFKPNNHCLFRARETLKRLRICSSDWVDMNFIDGYLNETQYRERQRDVIADLKALQVLELTVKWLEWDIRSDSLQLVHILNEPIGSYEDPRSRDEITRPSAPPPRSREQPLRSRGHAASVFIKLVHPDFLPALKAVILSDTELYEEHNHYRRFGLIQSKNSDNWPTVYLTDKELWVDEDPECISVRELGYRYPWLYDGRWEGKLWDESRRFW
ncbi:hypothetical protein Dda_4335 [Drechslerella dactyloides]|uniref:F-box domain-containing protein n=1 Tax=Drechslerella dactyloides TaxID=74499 RepID=A0AAD6IWS3_DREDA|nr:hypothetical protein Dda_4335 [Drechslerella dactyloides]